jgi:anti-anti-sigma regulatory factor
MKGLMHWDLGHTQSAANTMAEPTPTGGENFTFHVLEDGFCEITVAGELTPATTSAIAQRAQQYVEEKGSSLGILLDLRGCTILSIVRLSSLIDTISHMQVLLAVVFPEERQLEIASLLHHTLSFRDYVAYFTTTEGAWFFLHGPD